MITTLLFDMGNVLIHYDPQHFLDRMGVTDPQDQELLLREISLSPLWPKLDEGEMTEGELEALVLPRLPQRLHGYAHQLIFHWDDPIEPVPGMAALLEDCKRAGLKLYLLSNASRRQPEYWENIPGSALFDGTVVSAFYRCVKPQREIYQVVLEKFGLSPESCVFVDDVAENIAGAQAAGIQGVVFTGDADLLRTQLRALGVGGI